MEYCQKLAGIIIENKKYESTESYLISELWKLENQLKNHIKVIAIIREKCIEVEFILEAISEFLKDI